MRIKDILWITSLLGLVYLHTLAQERSEKAQKIIIEKRENKTVVRQGASRGEDLGIDKDLGSLSRRYGLCFKFDDEDTAARTDEKRTIEIIIHSDTEKNTK